MEIIKDFRSNYIFDPQRFWDLTQSVEGLQDVSLTIGIASFPRNTGNRKIKVYFDVEVPNFTFLRFDDYQILNQNYHLVFLICPYTCNMLNERFNTTKFIPSFFFINEKILPEIPVKKDIPVLYTGHKLVNHLPFLSWFYDAMNDFNGQGRTSEILGEISIPRQKTYLEKMKILSKTKIAIVHNLLCSELPQREKFETEISTYYPTDYKNYFPQCKSRMFEAAASGCIILCLKDGYQTIDRYFTEGEDFLYFNDKKELYELIRKILNNEEEYRYLGENSRKKCLSCYTEDNFLKLLVREVQSLEEVGDNNSFGISRE